jgi:hypothetical protein
MTKTQIQVPEDLFAELKKFSRRREWSLAETFRRGAELLLETYPDEAPQASKPWQPPTSRKVGWKGLTAKQLRDLALDEEARNPFAK